MDLLKGERTKNFVRWQPTQEQLSKVQELAYCGCKDAVEFSTLLNITLEQFLDACILNDDVATAFKKGLYKAKYDLNRAMLDLATGQVIDKGSQFAAIRYTLQSRYKYDEQNAQTEAKIRNDIRRYKLEKAKFDFQKQQQEANNTTPEATNIFEDVV